MKIKLKKEEVVGILQSNRQKHVEAFTKALEGYKKKAISLMENELTAAKLGREFTVHLYMHMPHNSEAEYNGAIDMIQAHAGPFIVLSEGEFDKFVSDNWQWKVYFNQCVKLYVAK